MPAPNPSFAPPPLAGEARERLLARVAFEATWERDLHSDALCWDRNLESIFGYPHDEAARHLSWWRERVHPDDLARVEQAAAQAIRGGAPGWSSEYRFRRKDGSWAWVASRCAIERDADGRAQRAVGAMIDISKLKDTEARLRLFPEQIPARACVTDRELRVVWDAGAAFSSNPSVVGKTVAELFAQSPDRERVLEGGRRALAGESCRLEIDDGTAAAQLQLEPFRDPAGNVIGVVGIAFDITARVRSEEEVRAGQLLLRQVIETLPVGLIVVDRAGDIVLSNSAASQIWGGMIVAGTERRAKSKGFWHDSGKAIHPDEWASLRALEQGQVSRDELIDIETFDGRHKTMENYAAPIRDARGAITGAVVVNEDVTERVRAEEGVRKTERLLVAAEQLGRRHRVPRGLARRQRALDLRPRHGRARSVRAADPQLRHQRRHHGAQERRAGAGAPHPAARGAVAQAERGAGGGAPSRRPRAARRLRSCAHRAQAQSPAARARRLREHRPGRRRDRADARPRAGPAPALARRAGARRLAPLVRGAGGQPRRARLPPRPHASRATAPGRRGDHLLPRGAGSAHQRHSPRAGGRRRGRARPGGRHAARSEERRVGKECRSRWAPYH